MKYSIIIKNALSLEGGALEVAISGNRIAAIGNAVSGDADTVIDAAGKWLTPAFYNCHTHIPMVLFRGYADDLELFDWLNNHIWPAEARLEDEDIYRASRLACLEMIKSGTVFFNDSYFHQQETIRAAEELGLRACLGMNWLNIGNDDFYAKLRADNQRLFDNFRAGRYSSRIAISEAPHALYTVPEADLREIAERSARENLPVHMHLAETKREFEECQRDHQGLTPVEYMREVGLLNERARFAHAVWLTEKDFELVRESGAVLVTNATSNLKLCSGMFHFKQAAEAGVKVAIGTDGCASNNSHSFFSEMKFASLAAKIQSGDPTAGSAPQIFRAATETGAAAFVPEAGKLEAGKLADLLLIEPNLPYMIGDYHPVSNLVYSAESSCVDTVICDGKILMQSRIVPGEEEILAEARKACDKYR